ncbi:MAG: hypothetical protein J5518_08890 [Lachnospiraceae bacterium]|nr:hypothetical protein [Lachnospiraceae bacterium]
MIRPAIVIIGYNRANAVKRLLSSIREATYPEGEIPLVISVDKAEDGSSEKVVAAAREFVWEHGEKRVIEREKNMGLKQHVLSCGDLCGEYGSIIMLEDDLYVSPAFYLFAAEALAFTEGDERIGGISLYEHRMNVHVREPFEAVHDPYDNWYFQFASSWGQAFLAGQWQGFREWLLTHDNTDLSDLTVPANVSSWSDKSWLKYYIKYLIETDRYFLYPRISYTTNFSDAGEHARAAVNDLQVPLSGRRTEQMPFTFAKLQDTRSVYDAFFENAVLKKTVGERYCDANDLTIDLYGYRDRFDTRYVLSSKALPYRQVKGFARTLRPIDENVFLDVEGHELFLYDRDTESDKPAMCHAERLLYNYRAIRVKDMISVILYRLRQR